MAPQPHVHSNPQPGPSFTKKLMPLLPVIVAGIVGFLVGLANGIAGTICSIVAGLLVTVFYIKRMSVQQALDKLQKSITKIPFIMQIVYMIGTLVFFSIFSVVITKGGLMLPDGVHNPNTLVKYLSIIWVLPENFSKAPTYAFPGYPWLIILATIIMIVGTIIPERFVDKKIKPIIMLVGLILMTAAPTITHSMLGQKGAVPWDYLPVFYLAWVGMIMVMVAVYLPWVLEKLGLSGKLPLAACLIIPFMIPLVPRLFFITGSFEGDHHDAAEVISGWVAALIGMHNTSLMGKTTTTPPAPAPAPPADTPAAPGPDTSTIDSPPVIGPSGFKDGEVKTFKNPLGWGDDIELTYSAKNDNWHDQTNDLWYSSLEKYKHSLQEKKNDDDWNKKEFKKESSGHDGFDTYVDNIAKKKNDDFQQTQLEEHQKQDIKDQITQKMQDIHMQGWKDNQSAKHWEWLETGASFVEGSCDFGENVLEKMTGPFGTVIKLSYIGLKDVAKDVTESGLKDGWSVKSVLTGTSKGITEGVVDVGLNLAKGKLIDATGGLIPGLYKFPGADVHAVTSVVPKTIEELIAKEAIIDKGIKDGVKSAVQSLITRPIQNALVTDPIKTALKLK